MFSKLTSILKKAPKQEEGTAPSPPRRVGPDPRDEIVDDSVTTDILSDEPTEESIQDADVETTPAHPPARRVIPASAIRFPFPFGKPPDFPKDSIIIETTCAFSIARSYVPDPATGVLPWELADDRLVVSIARQSRPESNYWLVLRGSVGDVMCPIEPELPTQFFRENLSIMVGFPATRGAGLPILSLISFPTFLGPGEEANREVSLAAFGGLQEALCYFSALTGRERAGYSKRDNDKFAREEQRFVVTTFGDEEMAAPSEGSESSDYGFDGEGIRATPACPVDNIPDDMYQASAKIRTPFIDVPSESSDAAERAEPPSPSSSEEPRDYYGTPLPPTRPMRFKPVAEHNSALSVGGARTDRAFVIRGGGIGVFATPDVSRASRKKKGQRSSYVGEGRREPATHEMLYLSTLDVKALGKDDATHTMANATPSHMVLREGDRRMLLLDNKGSNGLSHLVYDVDIERSAVVSTYSANKLDGTVNLRFRDIANSQNSLVSSASGLQYQTATDSTFLGLTSNGLFLMDPRLGGSTQLVSESGARGRKRTGEFMYSAASRPNLTCVASSSGAGEVALGAGQVQLAVGNAKGEVRLFDKIGVRPKTMFAGLGQPIRGIDVTANGRFIIATCVTYLILYDTLLNEGPDAGRMGYAARMGQHKPSGTVLRLKPEDIARIRSDVKEFALATAHFDAPIGGRSERSIISGVGDYLITWSLARVRRGKKYSYSIKKSHDHVVAPAFQVGTHNAIVVTENDVIYEARRRRH
eukprot:gnl/Chilomastix_cuspidata/2586.p1 GENE.gnl/Chilomastix_cuspidata/2586~~gnl/Chilomastix_cuspidata/2586.p1  ORF type:complete len:758 (-),score=332.10 gnl/Chilomastix_cuspidata/2586:1138-3411(-)